MAKYNGPDFIVIDDDTINNVICRRMLQNEFPGANIQIFTDPEPGLAYINETYSAKDANNAILFLDINMQEISGWDVLDILRKTPGPAIQHLKIYLLSSSAYYGDKQKATKDPIILGYIDKPLMAAELHKIVQA